VIGESKEERIWSEDLDEKKKELLEDMKSKRKVKEAEKG